MYNDSLEFVYKCTVLFRITLYKKVIMTMSLPSLFLSLLLISSSTALPPLPLPSSPNSTVLHLNTTFSPLTTANDSQGLNLTGWPLNYHCTSSPTWLFHDQPFEYEKACSTASSNAGRDMRNFFSQAHGLWKFVEVGASSWSLKPKMILPRRYGKFLP